MRPETQVHEQTLDTLDPIHAVHVEVVLHELATRAAGQGVPDVG
jgi:predicted transcriptional regulator YheO